MVWHVFCDSLGLYPNYVVENLEQYTPNQKFLCVNTFPDPKLKNEKIICLKDSIKEQKKFIEHTDKPPTKIIFHAYQRSLYHFMCHVKICYPNCEIKWLFWSFELYNLPSNYQNLLEPFSLNKFKTDGGIIHSIKRNLQRIVPSFLLDFFFIIKDIPFCTEGLFIQSFAQIDSFISLLKNDYIYFQKKYHVTHVRYEIGAYLSLDRIIPNIEIELNAPKNNWIMIGHSSAYEGNQFEIISKIKAWSLKQKILIPLAYGSENYKNDIARYATESLDNLQILEKKVEPEDYYKLLENVSHFILNTKIQQGIGNLTALLWYGTKVFMREESSTYLDMKEWGLKIFSIEKDLNKSALEKTLTSEEIKTNREVLKSRLGEKSLTKIWQSI